MKRLIGILLFVSILLFSCSSDKGQEGDPEEGKDSTWKKSVAELHIHNEDLEQSTLASLDKFCWEKDKGDICALEPRDPREITDEQNPFLTDKGETLTIRYDYLTHNLPAPDEYIVIQYQSKDHIGEEIEVFDTDRPEDGSPKIITPEESGKYYYTVHLKWTEKELGEAYFAFFINVKQDS